MGVAVSRHRPVSSTVVSRIDLLERSFANIRTRGDVHSVNFLLGPDLNAEAANCKIRGREHEPVHARQRRDESHAARDLILALLVSHMGMKSTTPLPVTAGLTGGTAIFAVAGRVADALLAFVPNAGFLLASTKSRCRQPPDCLGICRF